jgi:hypothetical protein
MAEERYCELVHEIMGYTGTVIFLLREIEARLKEKRTLAWEEMDGADRMLQCLEEEMVATLGFLAQGRYRRLEIHGCELGIRWVLAVGVLCGDLVTRWGFAMAFRYGPVIRWVPMCGSVLPGLLALPAGRNGSWGGQEMPEQDQAFPRRFRTGTMFSPILEDSS